MRIDVLGVGFDNVTMAEAVDHAFALIHEEGAHYVVTPNPEIVEVCREDPAAKAAVNGADLVLPDGSKEPGGEVSRSGHRRKSRRLF